MAKLPEGIPRNTKLSNNSGLCGSNLPHSFDEVHPELNGDVAVRKLLVPSRGFMI